MAVLELQRTKYDCGIAAIRAALQFFGIKASYKKIYTLAETSKTDGTSSSNMLKVLEHYGLSFEVRQTKGQKEAYKSLSESKHVNILCIDNFGHWVVWMREVNGKSIIFDPEVGTMILSQRQLMNKWVTSKNETYAIAIWKA